MYILILTFATIFGVLLFQSPWQKYSTLIILFIALYPLLPLLLKAKDRKLFLFSLLVYGLFTAIVLISFRKIRDSLPPPEVTQDKIVGYAQFFGYPLHLDTILFFILTLLPLVIIFFASYKKGVFKN